MVYREKSKNVRHTDATAKTMDWVEAVCKRYKPDILILDIRMYLKKIRIQTH